MNVITKKIFISSALAALTLVLLSYGLHLTNESSSAPAVTFTTINGEKLAIADLKGKVILVNFWATNCLACVKEMPNLVKTYQQYKKNGFEIVAVAMSYDPPAQVLNYVTEKKLPFPVMHDGLAEISSQFGNVEFTPTTFIFDKQGKLLQRTIGTIDFVQLNKLLNSQFRIKS